MDCSTRSRSSLIPPGQEQITADILKRVGHRVARSFHGVVGAEDITQELWIALLQKARHFDGARGKWPAFVTVFARRQGVSIWRKLKARRRCPDSNVESLDAAKLDAARDCRRENAEEDTHHADLRIDVAHLLMSSCPATRLTADALQRDTIHNVEATYGRVEILRQRAILALELGELDPGASGSGARSTRGRLRSS